MKEGVLGSVLAWFASHLVAIGFIAFAVIAVVFRQPLFAPESGLAGPASPDFEVSGPAPSNKETEASATKEAEPVVRDNPGVATHASGTRQAEPTMHDNPGEAYAPAVGLPAGPVAGTDRLPVFRPMDATGQGATPKSETDLAEPTAAKPVFRDPDRQPVDPVESPRARFEAMLRQAREAVKADEPKQAESLYLRCLDMDPGNPVPFAELGDLYRSMGQTQEALDAYYEAGVRFERLGAARQLADIRAILAKAGDARIRKLSVPRPN